jgi:hypothetical protein
MSSRSPSARDITVAETLELLDGSFAGLARGVADGEYAFWLGSAISYDQLPGLASIVVDVLDFLRERVDPALGDACPHLAALNKAVALADLDADEVESIDVAAPAGSWAPIERLTRGLVSRYSKLLDIRVEGQSPDYLLWEGVDVRATYGESSDPGAEHVAFAILVIEGVVRDAPTPNWDGLIEAALQELAGDVADVAQVIVLPADVRERDRNVRLIKFHGCAVLARRDPTRYQGALIARQEQITAWPNANDVAAIRNMLVGIATTRPTLMIGLSAQDANIQDVFSKAKETLVWEWPSDPPAHVFSGEELGVDHGTILRMVYGDAYNAQPSEVDDSAAIRAYAAALMTALVLHVLGAKACALITTCGAHGLGTSAREELAEGVITLRDVIARAADPDRLGFLRKLVTRQTRILSLFESGAEPPAGSTAYKPLTDGPVDAIDFDPTSGRAELAAAVAVLGCGLRGGRWTLAYGPTASGREGALKVVTAGGGEAALYFAANSRAALALERDAGLDATAGDVVMIHSTHPTAALPRSPRAAFGRTGRNRGPREVGMSDLLGTVTSVADLEQQFREAAAL